MLIYIDSKVSVGISETNNEDRRLRKLDTHRDICNSSLTARNIQDKFSKENKGFFSSERSFIILNIILTG